MRQRTLSSYFGTAKEQPASSSGGSSSKSSSSSSPPGRQNALNQFFKSSSFRQSLKNTQEKRLETIRLQGQSGNAEHLNELMMQLGDDHAEIRRAVCRALQSLVASHPRSAASVSQSLRAQVEKESDPEVKQEFQRLLRQLLTSSSRGPSLKEEEDEGSATEEEGEKEEAVTLLQEPHSSRPTFSAQEMQSLLAAKQEAAQRSVSAAVPHTMHNRKRPFSMMELFDSSPSIPIVIGDSSPPSSQEQDSQDKSATPSPSSSPLVQSKLPLSFTRDKPSNLPRSQLSSSFGVQSSTAPISSFSRRTLDEGKRRSTAASGPTNGVQRNAKRFKNGNATEGFYHPGRGPVVTKTNTEVRVIPDTRPKVNLSPEQQAVLEIAKSGKSFFFTGAAGTGKSFLLREIIRELQIIHDYNTVHITASTGIAACNIGGCTIHSFAGFGTGDGVAEELLAIVQRNKSAAGRWEYAKAIIIDEVSMLSGELFDKLDYVARGVRRNDELFGGIQIILCGDFLQLPPVEKGGKGKIFCFESRAWKQLGMSLELKHVFRQADTRFVNVLNEIRWGRLSNESLRLLEGRLKGPVSEMDDFPATILYPLKRQVEEENKKHLDQLTGKAFRFIAEDTAKSNNANYLSMLDKGCIAPKELLLKKDSQVILLKNLSFDKGLVNGARGKVIGFDEPEEGQPGNPIVQFSSGHTSVIAREEFSFELGGETICRRKQIPLDLAWAISIHKSQGMTIPKVIVNLKNSFEYGMIYTALSRATSIDGIQIFDLNPRQIKSHPRVLEFYQSLQHSMLVSQISQTTVTPLQQHPPQITSIVTS